MGSEAPDETSQRQWFIVSRWQEYDGEGRANLLRIAAVGSFYAVQLVQFYVLSDRGPAESAFQWAATLIAVAWIVAALAIHLCLGRQCLPPALKFLSTAGDLLLLTGLATAGSGPASPVVLGYFLILALVALRFSLSLIWFATLGSLIGYLATVGIKDRTWFDADHVVPPVEQLVMLLSLGLTGIILGQVVRRVRQLAAEFARRTQAPRKEAP